MDVRKCIYLEKGNAGARSKVGRAKRVKEIEDKLSAEKTRFEAELNALKIEHQAHLDMRTALSTKMLGESLEDHCREEFVKNQSLGLFPNAVFEKDTTGDRQGDFILNHWGFLHGGLESGRIAAAVEVFWT